MKARLSDDECVYGLGPDRFPECIRTDDAHWREQVTLRRLCDEADQTVYGPCRHVHQIPVESACDGQVVAWLCPHCDAQLDA